MGMIVAILVGVLHWSRKKKNILQAAIFADKFFNLKDSLTSALEFEKNQSLPIYELQKKQASERIQDLNPRAVPLHISKKLICSAVVGVISTASLAFIPPSPEVREKIAEREMTGSRTKEIKEALETKIEEMIQDLSHAEKKEIPPNTIRQWVSEIKQTPDRREALRHIARAEQKIQRSIDQLQNRKNEALLKKAGLSMLKVSDAKIKAIGKQLKNNELKKAAQSLAKFKFNKESKKDSNPKTKFNDKLKKLAELREFTKRLDQESQTNVFARVSATAVGRMARAHQRLAGWR